MNTPTPLGFKFIRTPGVVLIGDPKAWKWSPSAAALREIEAKRAAGQTQLQWTGNVLCSC